MELRLTIEFDQLLSLARQLSEAEKKKMMEALQKDTTTKESRSGKRKLDKYKSQIWMSDDFNEPLEEFKDYV